MVSFIDMESKRNQGILNCCLMFHCYVNPTVTILCNKSVREIVLKMFGIEKKDIESQNVTRISSILPTITVTNVL
ncbi:Protein CBG06787 [Caenorhabditis briggsae]|uniref:Protein CBG06787 n=1 Tax=Caenorhabditis briggsae TaxID=6238 RepID=A8X327_CAEBR|nr:Protein CBG06787 [Caenorhabditis briggsae]CAP27037.1 Protein CBG06787 [Caenorhabditis briggsae]